MTEADIARFAGYVAALGRGPGRSRPLTRAEAADAMAMLLAGTPDRLQVGAFLMLLRYRGEDPDEVAGLVEGARPATRVPGCPAALDWPSYGAGRTRDAPWFLLAALALAAAGVGVLMHGTNAFSGGQTVEDALAELGRPVARDAAEASDQVARDGFAYLPIRHLCPALADLLGLRRLLGLRSPVNTVARLLDPADAPAGIDGVFHPPYIETHLAVAERLARPRLLVLKGGGGEAERNPRRPTQAHVWTAKGGRAEMTLPPITPATAPGLDMPAPALAAVWHGQADPATVEARILATIELALLAADRRDLEARTCWARRLDHPTPPPHRSVAALPPSG